MKRLVVVAGFACALVLSSCTPGEKATVAPPSGPETKEGLEVKGHQLYATGQYDSALVVLQRLLKMDPANRPALRDLGSLHYEQAMMDRDEKSPLRAEHLRSARRYFSDLERLGDHDADLYDRLCEISLALGDNKTFLSYARKGADQYPYDRQYYNLGIGYFNVGDYQNVIKVEKAAIEKFKTSSFLSSYYRQLGRAYMKVDRDQTAERTFEDGLQIVNERLKGRTSPEDNRRLTDDRVAILLSLKHLYQTYHKNDQLKQVERQLEEAGYTAK